MDFVRGRRRLFVAVYFRSPIRPLVHVVVGLGRLVESGSVEGALVPFGCSEARAMKRLTYRIRFQQGLLFLLAVLAFGCKREPTTWTVDVALPLIDDGWSWVDVIEASSENGSIDVEEGTPAVLRFEGPVADWEIPSLTELPDTIVAQELTPDFTGGPFPVPPGTVLLDSEEDIVFQGIDQQFSGLVLSGGRIDYLAESSTNGFVELQYAFPSVTIGGEAVELKVVLPPSDGVAFQTESGTIDLAGAIIDLTGVSGNEINRIASQLVIGTPADITDTAQVYGTDSIRVRMHFQDMVVEQVGGYFGQETVCLRRGSNRVPTRGFSRWIFANRANPCQASVSQHHCCRPAFAIGCAFGRRHCREPSGACHPSADSSSGLERRGGGTDRVGD